MRHALSSLSEPGPSSSRLRGLGVLTRLARAVGIPGRDALVAASVVAGVVLYSAGSAPDAAQAMTGPGAHPVLAEATEPDSPDTVDAGGVAAAPAPDTAARISAGPDGLFHLQLVPGDSELRYLISFQTLGQPVQQSTCATRAVTGELVLAPDGSMVAEKSKFVADMRTMHCQSPLRDGSAQSLLETQKYPTAEATIEQAPGLPVPLQVGDVSGRLIGQQSLHGVTRHADYATTATFSSDDVTGHATTDEKFTNFNIKPPQIGPLFQVLDDMTIEVDFHATINR